MEAVIQVDLPPSKRPRSRSIDITSCFLCQIHTREAMVNESKSSLKLLESLRIRLQLRDTQYRVAAEATNGLTEEEFTQMKVTWHLSCYKNCVNKENLRRLGAKQPREFRAFGDDIPSGDSGDAEHTAPKTRSQGSKLDKSKCFFCDKVGTRYNILYTVATDKTGEKLFEAVQMSTNANWKLKLSGCIDPRDAHAYDIAYHKDCYSKNVLNPLRSRDLLTLENHNVGQSASITDFINSLADALMEGKVVTMAEAEEKYNDICDLNGVEKKQ